MNPLVEFVKLLKSVQGIPLKKSYYRFMGIEYLNNPLSGLGSLNRGGRYNFKNRFEALYLAPDPQTAIKESSKDIQFRFPPKAIVTIDVILHNVLNLEDKKVLETLDIEIQKLGCPWRYIQDVEEKEAYTQTLGRIIYESGIFEGICYPSVKEEGKYNLAVFPDRLKKKSKISVYDPDKILEQIVWGCN